MYIDCPTFVDNSAFGTGATHAAQGIGHNVYPIWLRLYWVDGIQISSNVHRMSLNVAHGSLVVAGCRRMSSTHSKSVNHAMTSNSFTFQIHALIQFHSLNHSLPHARQVLRWHGAAMGGGCGGGPGSPGLSAQRAKPAERCRPATASARRRPMAPRITKVRAAAQRVTLRWCDASATRATAARPLPRVLASPTHEAPQSSP